MKILVTGWNGNNRSFIPNAVAQHLKDAGHEVDGWEWDDRWNPDWKTLYGWTWDEETQHMVLASPQSRVETRPLDCYDHVIHLGAISSSLEPNVEVVMRQNFDFTLWLINLCQYHNIPLHYASSASVYGRTNHFQEEGNLDPKTPYAYSKYMIDRIVRDNLHRFKTPIIGFRYFSVYGIGEQHKGEQASLVYKFDKQSSVRRAIDIFSGSHNFHRDFVFVKDVCVVHEKLLGSDFKGIINVGTGIPTSIQTLAEKFENTLQCQINEIPFPEELKCHYQKYTCADTYQLNQLVDHKFKTIDEYFDEYY